MPKWKMMPPPRVLLERLAQVRTPGPRMIFRENVETPLGVETVNRVVTLAMEVPVEFRCQCSLPKPH